MPRCLAAALLCLVVWPAFAVPITLARQGKPAATIVIPAQPDAKVRLAATDLQHYVKLICGVELPIRDDGKAAAGTGLYIGRCDPTTEADLPAKGANPETYAIHVRDGGVFLTGRWPTPTYFAVASFLEDSLGVRWFAPGELWEYVPAGKPGELVAQVHDRVSVPSTSPRIWSGHDWTESWRTWDLRNKAVLSEVVPRRQFQNFLYQVFPPERYGKEHPEYYPLIDGRRWIPEPGGGSHWRPCESNPDVLRLTVEYARKWFDEHPNIDSFSLGMDDISHLCGCPACRAMDPHPDSYEKGEFSDRHYKLVNAVAREVRKTHPDRYIGTLIYAIARELPTTVPRLEDNVFGFITETSALWYQPRLKQADHELTRQWTKRCKHLSRYDYYGFGTFTPRVYPHHMAEQIKFDKSLGMEGMYIETYTFLPNTAPMIWACARLQWDHTRDIDALLSEFYARMYGAAAPVMKQYFDLLERAYNTPRRGHSGWEHRDIAQQAAAMSREDVAAGFALLDRATRATMDARARERIAVHRAGLQYGSYAILANAISQQLTAMAVGDEKSAREAVALCGKLDALSVEREKTWAEAPNRPDLLGDTVRGLGGVKYLVTGDIANCERGGLIGAMKALDWYAVNAPGKLPSVLRRLSGSGAGAVSAMARGWMWVQTSKPPNLLVNGDFEDQATNTEKAQADWRTGDAPKGWSVWSATAPTRFTVVAGKGQRASAAASITDGQSSCYLQPHPAKAGERYLCVAWAKADTTGAAKLSTAAAGAHLAIRFRDTKGAWHERRDLEPSVHIAEGQSGWQPLVLLVTVPEGAGELIVMAGASRQTPGVRALFDGVALYRLPAAP